MLLKENWTCRHHKIRLYETARKRGIPKSVIRAEIKARWGADSSGDLTMEQYYQLLAIVRTFPKKPRSAPRKVPVSA